MIILKKGKVTLNSECDVVFVLLLHYIVLMRRLGTVLSTKGNQLQDNSVQFDLFHNTLNIRLIDATSFEMTVTIPNNNYFAIGFGENMYDTDMIMW
jgi:hypothetical protein